MNKTQIQGDFNHELLASCRTRKKYLKNSVKKYNDIYFFFSTLSYNLVGKISAHFNNTPLYIMFYKIYV
jgi:hypothetical protein